MDKTRRNKNMFISTLFMGVLALVLFSISYQRGEHLEGIRAGLRMVIDILPMLIFAFIIAGMM